MNKSIVTDLTVGNVPKLLLKFAFPLFLSNALQAIYNLVDMIVVGQYVGGAGMAAVSIGGDILHLLTFIAMGFSSAGQVLIAQDVGSGKFDRVRKTIGTMFTLLFLCSIAVSVVCYLIRIPMLGWLNTPDEAYEYTLSYTVTCIIGLVFIYGYNIVSAVLRGMGDSRRPFAFVAIAALVNLVLDVIFVVFFGMEVFGAALATVIAQGISFIISIIYLYRKKESFFFDFKLKSFAMEKTALRRILTLGIPMAIQSAAISLSKIVLMAWINAFGVVYAALAGVFNKVNTMIGIVSNSFTTAGSAMVGQNLGAGKDERVPQILKTVNVCGMLIAIVFSLVVFLFPDQFFAIFTDDVEVLKIAGILVYPIILNFFGAATRSVSFSLINGSGNTKLNLAVAIIDGVISRVGIAALLGFALHMDCLGFWYGDSIAGFMPLVIGFCFFASGAWKTKKTYQNNESEKIQ